MGPIKLSLIFEKYNLTFWKKFINEMIIVLEKFDIDAIINSRCKNKNQYEHLTVKEGWGNHRLFGSLKNQNIVRRNGSERILELNDSNISIFNKQCHPFLDAALISIGVFINNDDTQINYSDIFLSFMVSHSYLLNKS